MVLGSRDCEQQLAEPLCVLTGRCAGSHRVGEEEEEEEEAGKREAIPAGVC